MCKYDIEMYHILAEFTHCMPSALWTPLAILDWAYLSMLLMVSGSLPFQSVVSNTRKGLDGLDLCICNALSKTWFLLYL